MGGIAIVIAVIGLLSNSKPSGIAAEEEMLINEFLDNYYAQLSYTQEEQALIEQEIQELSLSEEVKPDGFYCFYKEALTPQLYSGMIRNRKLPNFNMMDMAFDKSENTGLKLEKEKDMIHANFKAACYLEKNLIEEKTIGLSFELKKI